MGLFNRQPKALREAYRDIEANLPAPVPRAVHIDDLPATRFRSFNGSKFVGGLGAVNVTQLDYWSLRQRSSEFFSTRLFARGIIRRLTSAVITAGLYLECTPVERLLGMPEDSLSDWAEDVEQRFTLWGKDPFLCDATEQVSFGALQATAWREALVDGDCLVTMQPNQGTRIPRVKIFRGSVVQTPLLEQARTPGGKITQGVELDAQGRHVAYWIRQEDGSFRRLPAWGEKSGRRLAWLVYAADKRVDEVRGQPLLGLVLQSLSELDGYRDSASRKANLNSTLAVWIEKTQAVPSGRGLAAGAVRADEVRTTSADGNETREFTLAQYLPGMFVEDLAPGEKIHQVGGNGTDEKYGDFEEAILQGIAWALEIPPEILRLSFSSNYSASKAAENNFAVYLFQARTFFAEQFCQPIYIEWLIAEALAGNVRAQGLLESWRDPSAYVTLGAWTLSDWSGNVKPSVDPVKQVNAYDRAIQLALIDPATACREFSGQKLSRNLRQLAKYMKALRDAGVPDAQPKAAPQPAEDDEGRQDREDAA